VNLLLKGKRKLNNGSLIETTLSLKSEKYRSAKKRVNECVLRYTYQKIFDPGRVSHLWFGFEFGKFPLKMSNFSIFFPSGQKNLFGLGTKVPGSKAGRPLIYCGSKVSSGWARAHLYSLTINSFLVAKGSKVWLDSRD